MVLDRLGAAVRPRSDWESIDLGFAMARRWFLPLWTLWWLSALPVAVLLLVPLHNRQDLWLLAVWWLKPLFEAMPLFWLSRALFGERADLRQAAGRFTEAFPRRLWPQLLWRRLGLSRSFAMPVTLLEELEGGRRRERLRVLRAGAAAWLTVICVHLESVLWLSTVLLLAFLVPDQLPELDLGSVLFNDQSVLYWLGTLCMLLAMSVMAPFYVAAGFALYLGRRTRLEAWDLELVFRRSASPAVAQASVRRLPAAAVVLSLLCLSTLPAPAPAETPLPDPAAARALIAEVLADGDFGSSRDEDVWVYVGEQPDQDLFKDGGLPAWLPMSLILAIASTLKWILAVAALTALLLLAHRLWLELGAPRMRDRRRRLQGDAAPSMDADDALAEGVLPEDIATAVKTLLAAGDARGALALLYRAQIAHLRSTGLEIPDSATEADCLAAAASADAAERDWLRRLTSLWQSVAYAHQPADAAAIGRLLASHPAAAGTADHAA